MTQLHEPFKATYVSDQSLAPALFLQTWIDKWPELSVGFTTRHGGESPIPFQSMNVSLRVSDDVQAVMNNRNTIEAYTGLGEHSWTCAEQVHGTQIRIVKQEHRGAGRERIDTELEQADALLTNEPGIMLVSFYADCVPLYFFDSRHHIIGLAHAGWKGTYGRISKHVMDEMATTYGTSVTDLHCAVGPSIGGCCYEVDRNLIEQFATQFPHMERFVTRSDDQAMLDLKALNISILLEAGVPAERITSSLYCTSCSDNGNLFFSHRRDQGKTGRMISWIGLKKDEPDMS
jgi:YfiH family protein